MALGQLRWWTSTHLAWGVGLVQVRVGGSLLPVRKSLEQSTGRRRLSPQGAETPRLSGRCGQDWLLSVGEPVIPGLRVCWQTHQTGCVWLQVSAAAENSQAPNTRVCMDTMHMPAHTCAPTCTHAHGPLHWLFPLHETLSFKYPRGFDLCFLGFLTPVSPVRGAFPGPSLWQPPAPPFFHFLLDPRPL